MCNDLTHLFSRQKNYGFLHSQQRNVRWSEVTAFVHEILFVTVRVCALYKAGTQ